MESLQGYQPKSILLLNMIAFTMGDSLYILPLAQKLRKTFPGAKIVVTGSEMTKQLIFPDTAIDEFIVLKDWEMMGRQSSLFKKVWLLFRTLVSLIKKLRSMEIDLALVMQPNLSIYQIVPYLSRVKKSIGYAYKGNHFKRFLTSLVEFRNPHLTGHVDVHLSEACLDLIRPLGLEYDESDLPLIRSVPKEEIEKAKILLLEKKITRPLLAIHPGAKAKHRQWPHERFGAVAKWFVEYQYGSVIVLGSKTEFEICERVCKAAGNNVHNFAGLFPLTTVAGLLAESDLAIGNDSGMMHLAASVGVKVIGIFGSPNPKHSAPLGRNTTVIVKSPFWHSRALLEDFPNDRPSKYTDSITVEAVLTEVKRLFR